MANHKSAEKRARQIEVRSIRNQALRSSVRTASKQALSAKTPEEKKASLSKAFSVIQKARRVLHRNTIKRKMARLAKAMNRKGTSAEAK